ncbi:energy-coupling factor transporter ATPase [Ethanoligenens harbinense]|uniref:Energy-coupling factor transporter ATP-binding protein EcfA2 n=1 Tax=Ethanoligenens harbinense (strain DSM 18485 / JCM 12961 / CGMCC 1.5033 / YUAN-3) TaxID=663278 RepID=E6U475_ETHHY|nr:energy-coupling factor transporter ATPase [Ethanoligenens harbinense]ADU26575.1 ABC transporter related protein [Ethanoligenens harbinense YUAN-3]
MPIIQTQQLTYKYGAGTPFEQIALDHVDLSIEEGEFVGVIGHTGSGKSTLLQHFNGLLKPGSGRVLIDGNDIWAKNADKRALRFLVGLVFQYPEYQLFEETVYKDIAFGPHNMGLSDTEIDERVREAADFVGVEPDWLDKSPFALSGGQKRRVAIAGVLAMRPKVLILDEPAAGLDPRGRESILARIRDYQRTQGNTVLLVSHSMEDIARLATRVLVMDKGKALLYDTVPATFARSRELLEMGLDVPQITRVFLRLKEMGFSVHDTVYTIEQGKDEILRVLKEAGR